MSGSIVRKSSSTALNESSLPGHTSIKTLSVRTIWLLRYPKDQQVPGKNFNSWLPLGLGVWLKGDTGRSNLCCRIELSWSPTSQVYCKIKDFNFFGFLKKGVAKNSELG